MDIFIYSNLTQQTITVEEFVNIFEITLESYLQFKKH